MEFFSSRASNFIFSVNENVQVFSIAIISRHSPKDSSPLFNILSLMVFGIEVKLLPLDLDLLLGFSMSEYLEVDLARKQ